MRKTDCFGYFNDRFEVCKSCLVNKDCKTEYLSNTVYMLSEVLKVQIELEKVGK